MITVHHIQGSDDKQHLTEAREAMAIIAKVAAADIKPYEDVTGGSDLISEERLKGAGDSQTVCCLSSVPQNGPSPTVPGGIQTCRL